MSAVATQIDVNEKPETRREERANAYISVDVFSEHNFYTGLSMNMSEGGVFVATYNVAPVGSIVVIHMSLPFETEPVVMLAEVRWTRPPSDQPECPPGLGLQFVNPEPEALERVKRFVQTVREPLFFEE
jgi:uncharacterized protein (TIGR02266 family)